MKIVRGTEGDRRHRPTLITVGSTKGGTGKTTTLLNLGEMLARHARVLIIDLHYDNPQHQEIFGGKKPRRYWLQYDEKKGVDFFYEKEQYSLREVITLGKDTEIYRKRESNENISFMFLDPKRPSKAEYALRAKVTETKRKSNIFTEEQKRRIRYTLPLFPIIASSGSYDCVLVDTDAGNTDTFGSIAATLHRSVDGYGKKHELDELSMFYKNAKDIRKYEGTESPLLDPITEAFGDKMPFESGYRITVTNTSKADISTLLHRKERFPNMGENNHYSVVVNQCPKHIQETRLREKVKLLLPKGVFEGVYFLPRVDDVGFGNITDENQHLTTQGNALDQRLYATKLKKLSDAILSVALKDAG